MSCRLTITQHVSMYAWVCIDDKNQVMAYGVTPDLANLVAVHAGMSGLGTCTVNFVPGDTTDVKKAQAIATENGWDFNQPYSDQVAAKLEIAKKYPAPAPAPAV